MAAKLMAEVGALKDQLQADEDEQRELEAELSANSPSSRTSRSPMCPKAPTRKPMSRCAAGAIRRACRRRRLNKPRQHFEIGEALGMMDFEAAARISGARFVVLKGALARLERALGMFMLDIHTGEFGYTECQVPLLVRDPAMYGTAQLPKFEEDLICSIRALKLPSDRHCEDSSSNRHSPI